MNRVISDLPRWFPLLPTLCIVWTGVLHAEASGDCAPGDPTTHDVPSIIESLTLRPTVTPGTTRLEWDSLAAQAGSSVVYDMISGDLSDLRSGVVALDICPLQGLSLTDVEIEDPMPCPGTGFWYLVRGTNSCGDGPWDSGGVGQAALRDPGSCEGRGVTRPAYCGPFGDQSICEPGPPLDPDRHPCVVDICQIDPSCCSVAWDTSCVDQVLTVCGDLVCGGVTGSCDSWLCDGMPYPPYNPCPQPVCMDAIDITCYSGTVRSCLWQLCSSACCASWGPACHAGIEQACGLSCP
ncbi:MAG: hypothetical protein GY716_23250 [bacterium]|nr:hypothetical protein [bacterium]